jgi:LPS-assembly protein
MYSVRSTLLLLAAISGLGLQAQSPQPAPTPAPAQSPAPPAGPGPGAADTNVPPVAAPQGAAATAAEAAGPAAPSCTLEEPCVRSDTQGFEAGRYWFDGFVDMRAGEVRVQADRVEIEDRPGLKGTERILHARGNVVFQKQDERLAGATLELNLASGKGTLMNASGFLQPGVLVEARKIERVDSDTYVIEGGNFTACWQTNPRWNFKASWARLDIDKRIQAANVVFKVKSVSAFYFPYFIYPINSQGRSTGFLFPHFGYSSSKGVIVGDAFFWAMGRSFDQTFYADSYSRLGYGLGHEFRYSRDGYSRGEFRTYALKPKDGGDWDYDLNWNALQQLPGKVRASVAVRQTSNLLFQTRVQDTLNEATMRTKRVSANLQRNFGATQVRLAVDDVETFFPLENTSAANNRQPAFTVTRSPKRVARSFPLQFAYDLRAERLGLVDTSDEGTLAQYYQRFDVAPRLAFPLALPFLRFTPRAAYRYTRYSATTDDQGFIQGPAVNRRYFEGSTEIVGPQFSRVFNAENDASKLKHVISPELTWTYRSHIDDFDVIPFFDQHDVILGTNQFDYGLLQEFYNKRANTPGGKLVPYMFLRLEVTRTYYVDIADGQNAFDPNYGSSSFGPGGVPDHNSPIRTTLRFRPTPRFTTDVSTEYDVAFKALRRVNAGLNANGTWGSVGVGWSRGYNAFLRASELTKSIDTVRGQTTLRALSNRLTLTGMSNYDLVNQRWLSNSVAARWNAQCCGFHLEFVQFDLGNDRKDTKFTFGVELAGIGSMGNFMSQDTNRSGLAGYR